MFTQNKTKVSLVVIMGLAVVGLFLISGLAAANSQCQTIKGKFILQSVAASECNSPVDFCARGIYKGDIKGNSQFIGSSLIPTTDTPTTGVVLLTGDNVIETDHGSLTTKDAIVLKTTGAGEFSEVDVVTGGTGNFAGMTGTLQTVGTFTGMAGEGEYQGQLCRP